MTFLLVTCQAGAERAVKGELARRWPDFRVAFSRKGFLTFKLPEGLYLPADFDLESVFARTYAFSLGHVSGDDVAALAREVWQLWGDKPFERIHVWQRDMAEPGENGFEATITAEAILAAQAIREACPRPERLPGNADPAEAARPGDRVLDCVLVDPGQWWIGTHRARGIPSRYPGGMMPLVPPADMVSRAWLKMEEALRWSQLPISAGARCAELGSAPGGASQALLARGVELIGVDPAEMDATIMSHPNFQHFRCRATDVRRRDFRKIRWLTADMNVAPNFTLDAVEGIVTYPQVNVRGLLLTLKLLDWQLAFRVPEYLDRVRSWGYNVVHARQLQYDRREFCVAAIQKPFKRKPSATGRHAE